MPSKTYSTQSAVIHHYSSSQSQSRASSSDSRTTSFSRDSRSMAESTTQSSRSTRGEVYWNRVPDNGTLTSLHYHSHTKYRTLANGSVLVADNYYITSKEYKDGKLVVTDHKSRAYDATAPRSGDATYEEYARINRERRRRDEKRLHRSTWGN